MLRAFRIVSTLAWTALVLTSPVEVAAQAIETQLFLPTPGVGTTFTVDRPTIPRHLTFVGGLALSYGRGLLVRDEGEELVAHRGQAEALVALGLFEVMEIGAAIPVVLGQATRDPAGEGGLETVLGLGDARLALKVPILRGPVALAARGVITLPTGPREAFLGNDYWTLTPSALLSIGLGRATLGAELGYRMRRRVEIGDLEHDDELAMGLGVAMPITEQVAALVETGLRAGVGGRTMRANEFPWDANVGVRVRPHRAFTVEAGGGTGLLAGYGAPAYRLFATVRFASEREPCAFGPEDYDGYQDSDFCADPDNDGDGLLDEVDECPNDAEDRDGFQDSDGCPDPDNDGDGVPDAVDLCPLDSEDRDGHEDTDGCPEPDNDQDGIPDGLDRCPNDPEDRDGFEDEDGCPEPGPKTATVTVSDSRILISERIYFDFDRDTIRSVSKPLLDEVAAVILALPSDRRIRVEGYTDGRGNPGYNLDLSYRRARSVVEYLASQGVPRERLEYVGYGSERRVADDETPDGQALNRRVEFTILEPSDRMDARPPTTRRRR